MIWLNFYAVLMVVVWAIMPDIRPFYKTYIYLGFTFAYWGLLMLLEKYGK